MMYIVEETVTVTFTYHVEADSQEEAIASAGVCEASEEIGKPKYNYDNAQYVVKEKN